MRIGIDLGGTNLAYGLVDDVGQIVKRGSTRLGDYEPSVIADNMLKIYREYAAEYEITTLGIGVPGIVSQEDGVVITCVNLNWKMVPLATYLRSRIKCDIVIGNDANAACVGETLFGGMKGYQNAILLTLGTGVGGGVIAGGKLLTGYQGAGAELGHMIIDGQGQRCNCGNIGCLETFISATALIKDYNRRMLTDHVDNAKAVFDRYVMGQVEAQQTVDEFVDRFATGIINLYNIFAPEIIAIGGGVSLAFDLFKDQLESQIDARLFSKDIVYGKIVRANLHNDAGIIGAAYLDQF